MFLAGLSVPDRLVLRLASLVGDDALETKLRNALARDVKMLALEIPERETILAALDDPPEGLEELRGVLFSEREWLAPRKATITGVGFFDVLHGQTGVAPNGIGLHPALAFIRANRKKATSAASPAPAPRSGNCDASYPTVCIPPPPPDLNCADVSYTGFKVLPPDPHHFDGDKDGVGCES